MKGLSLNLSEDGSCRATLLLDRDKASVIHRLNYSIDILLIHIGLRKWLLQRGGEGIL